MVWKLITALACFFISWYRRWANRWVSIPSGSPGKTVSISTLSIADIPALKSNGIADGRYDDRPGYLIQIQLPGKLPGSVRAIQLIPVNRPVDPQHRPRFRPRCHNYRELDHRFMSQLPCGNGKICPLPCLNLPSKYFCHPFYHLSLPAASLLLPPLFCSILKAYCIIPISL